MPKLLVLVMFSFFLFIQAHAAPGPTAPVSQEKFNRLIALMKKMYQRIEDLEAELENTRLQNSSSAYPTPATAELQQLKNRLSALESSKASSGSPGGDEGAVNLDDLDSSVPAASGAPAKNLPILKAYFDLNLYVMPGGPAKGSGFTFDNFHSFILLDFIPSEDILFFTEVSTSPNFFEINYRLAKDLHLRMGKIAIPFDDMDPHNIFGGRTNVSRITVGQSFLPDYFADLGAGLRWKMFNSPGFVLDTSIYAVNGFRSGGTDPVNASNTLYPNFSSTTTGADNNKDKSLGGRAHALMFSTWGLGVSYYTGRYTDEDAADLRLNMLGVDSQLYFTNTTSLRAGVATMNVQQLSTAAGNQDFLRNGSYLELSQKFGSRDQWNFLIRGGTLNLDDRVVDRNDKEIIGAKLLWKPDLLEWSIEHSEDTKRSIDKTYYRFTNFRVIASF